MTNNFHPVSIKKKCLLNKYDIILIDLLINLQKIIKIARKIKRNDNYNRIEAKYLILQNFFAGDFTI